MPSNSAPGIGRGRTPVATTIDSAVTVSAPTWILCGATTLAVPSLCVTLYFLKSCSIPLFRLLATPRLRPIIWPKSHLASPL